jgi:hypothetical protein
VFCKKDIQNWKSRAILMIGALPIQTDTRDRSGTGWVRGTKTNALTPEKRKIFSRLWRTACHNRAATAGGGSVPHRFFDGKRYLLDAE